ncbi:hypothetical protein AX16_006255 [Volvariella volvacea WC 439]|nr:hypothetical protein AX16_006255 [Volvariella volvacea WC 439]
MSPQPFTNPSVKQKSTAMDSRGPRVCSLISQQVVHSFLFCLPHRTRLHQSLSTTVHTYDSSASPRLPDMDPNIDEKLIKNPKFREYVSGSLSSDTAERPETIGGTKEEDDARKKIYTEVEKHDNEMCKGWNEEIQNLLIFASLFAATVTAFTIESYKWLESDPAETTAKMITKFPFNWPTCPIHWPTSATQLSPHFRSTQNLENLSPPSLLVFCASNGSESINEMLTIYPRFPKLSQHSPSSSSWPSSYFLLDYVTFYMNSTAW